MPITRYEPSKILSKVVEANGFVYTAGVVADDNSLDVKGQTAQTLKEIDRLLKLCGANKSKVISATIWLPDIRLRDQMNEAWNASGPRARICPAAPASKPSWPTRVCWSRSR